MSMSCLIFLKTMCTNMKMTINPRKRARLWSVVICAEMFVLYRQICVRLLAVVVESNNGIGNNKQCCGNFDGYDTAFPLCI